MDDPKMNDRSDEMEHDLEKLGEHIEDAERKLEARKEDADIVDDVAGEPGGPQDTAGEDPAGAVDERSSEEYSSPT